MSIFCPKKSLLSKTRCSNVIFSNFSSKTPCHHLHNWSKNVDSVKTTLYHGQKESVRCPFFRFFTKKCMLSCPYIVKKPSILRKTSSSHANVLSPSFHSVQIFMKKLPALLSCTRSVKKTLIQSTLQSIMDQKS